MMFGEDRHRRWSVRSSEPACLPGKATVLAERLLMINVSLMRRAGWALPPIDGVGPAQRKQKHKDGGTGQ